MRFLNFSPTQFLMINEILVRKIGWAMFNICAFQRKDFRTFKLKSVELGIRSTNNAVGFLVYMNFARKALLGCRKT